MQSNCLVKTKQNEQVDHEERFTQENFNTGTVKVHVEPPQIPLIKMINNENSDKYFVNIKLCKDQTSAKLDLYEFRTILFDKGNLE